MKMNNIRKIIRITVTLILAIAIIPSALVACKGGIDKDSAKTFIEDFLEVMATGDYEVAESYLHPDCLVDLEKLAEKLKNNENIDLGEGITVEKYTGFSSAYYDSKVGGSRYALAMRVSVGDNNATFTVEVVQNGGGYGIYSFEIDAD
jgi:hypothetical protein